MKLPFDEFVRPQSDFKGWIRKDLPPEAIAAIIDQFDAPNRFTRLLKEDGKSRVVRESFEDRTGKRWDVVIKRVSYRLAIRRLGFWFFASPAFRSLKGALLLQQSGILTARPLAAVEKRGWDGLGTSYYFAEAVEGKTLYALWRELCDGGAGRNGVKRHLLKRLAAFVHRLHESGIYHRDLKGSNILQQRNGRDDFVLVDTDGVRKMDSLRWRKRIKNLVQICRLRRMSERDKMCFLQEYSGRCGVPKRKMKSLMRRVSRLTRSTTASMRGDSR